MKAVELSMDMEKVMNYSNLFITGYDKNNEWMLKWFLDNFTKHNETPILPFDFDDFQAPIGNASNWFKKPFAMIDASRNAERVCWIDLDCHVQGCIDDIWDYVEPNKLGMVEDLPWSTRSKEKWHNSGVVAFEGRPFILDTWASEISLHPKIGDQEVLHNIVKHGLGRLIHITDLPRRYNTLRLDVIDNTVPKDMKVMHWTGYKGKDEIRKMIQ